MRKADIQFHREYSRPAHAAINVKVHGWWGEPAGPGSLAKVFAAVAEGEGDPHPERFTPAWAATLPEQWRQWAWESACEEGWEHAGELAREIFGDAYRVTSEGRSGGWLIVTRREPVAYDARSTQTQYRERKVFDRDEVAGWDAIAVARWARFDRYIRATVADTWYRYAWRLYVDRYQAAEEGISEAQGAHVD